MGAMVSGCDTTGVIDNAKPLCRNSAIAERKTRIF
jgi:hypothetical protein